MYVLAYLCKIQSGIFHDQAHNIQLTSLSRNATVTNRKCFNCTESGRGRKDGVTKLLPNLSAILAPFVKVRTSFRLFFGHSVFKEKEEEFKRVL